MNPSLRIAALALISVTAILAITAFDPVDENTFGGGAGSFDESIDRHNRDLIEQLTGEGAERAVRVALAILDSEVPPMEAARYIR